MDEGRGGWLCLWGTPVKGESMSSGGIYLCAIMCVFVCVGGFMYLYLRLCLCICDYVGLFVYDYLPIEYLFSSTKGERNPWPF